MEKFFAVTVTETADEVFRDAVFDIFDSCNTHGRNLEKLLEARLHQQRNSADQLIFLINKNLINKNNLLSSDEDIIFLRDKNQHPVEISRTVNSELASHRLQSKFIQLFEEHRCNVEPFLKI